MHFVDYTTTKKCEKNNNNTKKKEKLEKRKKRTPYIYKACALLSVDCSVQLIYNHRTTPRIERDASRQFIVRHA